MSQLKLLSGGFRLMQASRPADLPRPAGDGKVQELNPGIDGRELDRIADLHHA